jgi:predicted nucleic-acid-binding protein
VSLADEPAAPLRGLDTNVLVRYFALDDPAQSALARDLVDGAEDRGERFFVSLPVLCELVWTLSGPRYRSNRQDVVAILAGLLDSPGFVLQDRALVRQAVEDFRAGRADFADYLIGRSGVAAGCAETVTFDGGLVATPGFRFLAGPDDLAP